MDVVGKRVGNYVIERPLAQGGMGAVYVALHPTLGRLAAVKFLDPGLGQNEELSKRFLDEARVTANLRHPNIIDIFDFGELEGRFYYVMELLPGTDLSHEMNSVGRYSPEQACRYLRQISAGLAAAHEANIVHRDLKPANIFVKSGGPPQLKLMDFGVAKVQSASNHTNYGQVLGTPAYMAPEQALGQLERITARSDLYSLGVIAYEMLSGGPLFQHAAPMMLLVMHIHEPPRPLRSVAPEVPRDVAELVDRCLAKDPAERPSSAREVEEELRRILANFGTTPDSLAAPVDPGGMAGATNPFEASTIASSPGPFEALEFARTLHTTPGVGPRPPGVEGRAPSESLPTPPTESASADVESVERAAFRTLGLSAKPKAAVVPVRSFEPAPEAVAGPGDVRTNARPSPTPVPESRPKGTLLGTPPSPSPRSSVADPNAPVDRDVLELSEPDLGPEPAERPPVALTEEDRNILHKLLQRMQRKGDLPAFVQNVGEVNKRSDVESTYSAEQLSDSILKDYSLTARLLRVVNSSYVNRFGGRIYTIQHAIVILGFEKVRQLALSIAMFGKEDAKAPARVSDSAVHALVSGEMARLLASRAGIKDPDQAMLAAMFRNLGRHLTIVYLPELYDQIVQLARTSGGNQEQAATRVLGLSMHKLGMGIAEKWHLPKRFLEAMSAVPLSTDPLGTDEERLASLARLTNDLSDLVARGLDGPEDPKLRGLFERHRNLLRVEPRELEGLIEEVGESFRLRYAAILGTRVQGSRFLQHLSTLAPPAAHPALAHGSSESETAPLSRRAVRALGQSGERPAKVVVDRHPVDLSAEHGRPVAPLLLGQVPPRSGPGMPANSEWEETLAKIRAAIPKGPNGGSLELALRTLAQQLGLSRVLALRPNEKRTELRVSRGIGDDAEGLAKALSFSLGGSDLFSQAFREGRDIVVKDAFAERATQQVPVHYYEAIGSPAFALLVCGKANQNATVLLADVSNPDQLPRRQRLEEIRVLRELIAEAAA